jgi:hypothetical protein
MNSKPERVPIADSEQKQLFSRQGTDETPEPRCEDVHIRNFDIERVYDLTLKVRDEDGLSFANQYHLTPGKTVSELDRLPPGYYVVEATINDRRSDMTVCEIGLTPAKTVLVEIGNGTVSITEGLYK